MEKRYRIIRYFAYALEILIVCMIQQTPGLIPTVCGARPVIIMPVVLAIAMFEPEIPSTFFGLFGGLLIDFGMGGVLGFHGLLFAALCYTISMFSANLFKNNLLTSILINALCLAAVISLQWVFFYVLYHYQDPIYALRYHYLPRFLYTLVLTPITYYFNRAFAMLIQQPEE